VKIITHSLGSQCARCDDSDRPDGHYNKLFSYKMLLCHVSMKEW